MATQSTSHFTPITSLYLLLFTSFSTHILALNITETLSSYPDLSNFSDLLTTTGVAADLAHRSSLTILAVPNRFLLPTDLTRHSSSSANIADVLRYHVLLQYLTFSDLYQIPATGKLITTLYQTTGRANSNFGSVNITFNAATNTLVFLSPAVFSPSNATVLSLINTIPYNLTIFTVNSLLIPFSSDLTASETRPPLGLNITKTLIDAHSFNVAASMLSASGVADQFEQDEGGAGITLFVPTDEAFSNLPATASFQALPADKKADVLKFHVLRSYYPLGSLESIVNPVQPTLATEEMGAGSFTLNISKINGSVAINTGIDQATVTQTVFDQNPVAIFGVSKVLLPREIFGRNPTVDTKPGSDVNAGAEAPDISLSPEKSPDWYGPASHLTSPPGSRAEIRSSTAREDVQCQSIIIALSCIAALFLYWYDIFFFTIFKFFYCGFLVFCSLSYE